MDILWNYLKPYNKLVFLSLFLAALSQVLTMVDPVIFGKIIDTYATNPKHLPKDDLITGILLWLLIAVVVALLARVAKAFQEYLARMVVQKFGMQVFNDGLKHTLRLSFEEYEEQRSGETMAILQKVRTDTERFIMAFINVVFSSIVGIGFLIWYAITRHWALIPVFVLGVLVLGGLTGLLSKKIKTIQRSVNRENIRMSGSITESLRNIELVKSLGLTFPEIKRLREQTLRIFALEMQKVKRVRTLSFLQGSALSILKHSILFTLLWLIFRDVLTTGELISMQFISTAIFVPLQDLGNIILQYREAESSLNIFDKLLQKPIEQRPEEPVDIGLLEELRFENVIFRHKSGSQNAIDGISFEAAKGKTIAFAGPSGSGKSTLVKLLVGLYQPVEGEIFFNNVPSQYIRYNELRRQIGFVTQDTQLFAGTIRENMQFVKPDATDEDIVAALQKASARQLLARTDKGIDTLLGEGGLKLSGGERQRISIARALLRNPRLLIFDEATSSLDSLTEEVITDTIRDISSRREQITLLIAHRLSTIMHADEIIVLEKGKITETGTHDELVARKGLYYAMWRQQIGERRETKASGANRLSVLGIR